ncbi:MAG TPA: hypothetical protein VGD81_13585 [Opitutaceae bacterium]
MRVSCFFRYVLLPCAAGLALSPARGQVQPDARRLDRSPAGLTLLTQPTARLVVEDVQDSPGDLRVLDLDGQDVSARLQARSEGRRLSVALANTAPFIVKPKTVPRITLSAQKLTLPGGLVTPVVAAPNTADPLRPAWFRVTLFPTPVPAVWDAAESRYTMKLTLGVNLVASAAGAAAQSLRLQPPVTLKFGYEGLTADELVPVTIEAHGLEHEKTVELRFVPSTPSPRLLVRSSIADADLELKALPRLDVRPVQRSIAGFGLATVEVAIEHVLPHGERVAAPRALPVLLEIDGHATPEPRQPVIEAGASTTSFTLRTAGLGRTTIRASADGVTGGTVIEQTLPVGPVLAVLLGGALGGYARKFMKGARRAATGRRVVEGLIVGVIAFVAGLLGVGYLNLPPVLIATEAGAFLTGALCGFIGVTVLESLTKKSVG